MLKITTEHGTRGIQFRLDGKLAGAWVEELARSWQGMTGAAGQPLAVLVDLSGVTFVDSEGKRLLARMCAEGASFQTSCCMTRGIVEQIRRGCGATGDGVGRGSATTEEPRKGASRL